MQIQYALFGIGNSFNNSISKFGISNACQHQNTCIVLELYYIPGISFAKCEPNDLTLDCLYQISGTDDWEKFYIVWQKRERNELCIFHSNLIKIGL